MLTSAFAKLLVRKLNLLISDDLTPLKFPVFFKNVGFWNVPPLEIIKTFHIRGGGGMGNFLEQHSIMESWIYLWELCYFIL